MYRFFIASVFLLTQTAQAYDFQAVLKQHILPAYQQLESSTDELQQAASSYCKSVTSENAEALKQKYVEAFLDWQDVQHLRLGPVQYLSREHRFQMWPDKRGSVGKHLSRLISELQKTPPTDFDISKKSVAIQGFSALERLLYASKGVDNQNCLLIQSISGNLQNIATNLLNDWTAGDEPYGKYFEKPASDNPIYESDKELAGQLLNSLHTQLEFMITQKLDRPLGKSLDKARGKRTESWRSQSALSSLEHNLAALLQLYKLSFSKELANNKLDEKIKSQFILSNTALLKITKPLKQAVTNEQERQSVLDFRKQLSILKQLIGRDLAGTLSLSLGFNSLDGD